MSKDSAVGVGMGIFVIVAFVLGLIGGLSETRIAKQSLLRAAGCKGEVVWVNSGNAPIAANVICADGSVVTLHAEAAVSYGILRGEERTHLVPSRGGFGTTGR